MRPLTLARSLCVITVMSVLTAMTVSACATPRSADHPALPRGTDIARAFDLGGGRQVYLECHGASLPGQPTILLISGYHDAGDAWDVSDEISPPAVGPPVPTALAVDHRVCTYDRPGTVRYGVAGNPLTERSTPVPEPRTAADVVAELHALLAAAHVSGPFVLTGHSLGGLFALLYARTYPDQARGLVFDDAFSPSIPELFGARWAQYRQLLSAVPPGTRLAQPDAERIDIDRSIAQVNHAPPLRPMPVVVLTKTEPFQTALPSPPGLPWSQINRLYESAETTLVQLQPNTPQIFATGSDHYIQWHEPDLITNATRLVAGRATR
jgi:pimeloyl-ACP methyl ester carboxylesterase